MWYPATITTPAAAEPVTVAEAKRQVYVTHDDDNDLIEQYIAAARDHVEKYCGTRFASQTVTVKCDGFADFVRLPEGPVQSVTSVTYIDTDGAEQTLATSFYEIRNDGFHTSIVLKYGQQWPAIQSGSRVTVLMVVGDTVPAAVKQAMLLLISDLYDHRGNREEMEWSAFDSLLSNHRRGI